MVAVEDTECACRLSESERTLHASKQAQQRLQQQLAECQAELEEATGRADAAHSEALSYLSKVRQQDRQAQLDRSVYDKSPVSLSLCFMHATEAMTVVTLDPSVPLQILQHLVQSRDACLQICHVYLDQAQTTAQCARHASLLPHDMCRVMLQHRATEVSEMLVPCAITETDCFWTMHRSHWHP